MKRKYIKYIILSILLLFIIFLYWSCYPFFGYVEEEVYTSPEGSNTIIVKYDLVCRPDVFKKGFLWDKKYGTTQIPVLWKQCISGWNGYQKMKSC